MRAGRTPPILSVFVVLACGPTNSIGPDGRPNAVDAAVDLGPDAAVAAALRIAPSSQLFGTVVLGSNASAFVQVQNTGGSAVAGLTASVAGTDSDSFTLPPGGCNGLTLGANMSCALAVQFAPTTVGNKTATLTVKGPGGSPTASIELTGTAIAIGSITLTPAAPEFGKVAVGASKMVTMTARNTGGTTTGPLAIAFDGLNQDEFKLLAADNCSGKTLAGGAMCTFDVQFTPRTAGRKVASATARATPGDQAAAAFVATAQAEVKLAVGGTGQGTVASTPEGLSCGVGCSSAMNSFTDPMVTLLATPSPGSAVGAWQGCDSTPSANSCVMNLTGATRNVTVQFVGMPDAGTVDASTPDAPPGLRPWSGATAPVRFIDLQLAGTDKTAKICLFGDDGVDMPYLVLTSASHAANELHYNASATYVPAPKGIKLRASVKTGAGLTSSPSDCKLNEAAPLGSETGTSETGMLGDAAGYTLAMTRALDDVNCDSQPTTPDNQGLCEAYPTDMLTGSGTCPFGGLFVVADGGSTGGYRFINLIGNGAVVSRNHDNTYENLGLASHPDDYEALSGSTFIHICPGWTECYSVHPPSTWLQECAGGDTKWALVSLPFDFTIDEHVTFYVIGTGPPLSADGKRMLQAFNETVIVVAHDAD